jgi:hypothetical protein
MSGEGAVDERAARLVDAGDDFAEVADDIPSLVES